MRFERGIAKKYRHSIEQAFDVMLEKGNDAHRDIAEMILDSKMHVRVAPVSQVNASGVTGLIDRTTAGDGSSAGLIWHPRFLSSRYQSSRTMERTQRTR